MQTSGNIAGVGQYLQTWLVRQVLKNFEPTLRFYEAGQKPTRQNGYETMAWTKTRKMLYTPADVLLSQGVTPVEKEFFMDTISVKPKQYGLYVTLTDFLLDVSPLNLITEASKVIGANMARVVDAVIQDNLALNGVNVIYSGNVPNRPSITAVNTLAGRDLARANTFLSTKAAPTFGGGSYLAIMHPNCAYDLQIETGPVAWLEIHKYTEKGVDKLFNGEIGKIFNCRVVTSSFIQTFASTVTVYPTYVLGEGGFGVPTLQQMQTYYVPRVASDSDPLAQRAKVGAKIAFETIILQQDAILRIESASSQSFTW